MPAPDTFPAPTALILCNLGTPDAPNSSAVRRYLAQFLRDTRVIEIPRLIWWPILYGLILPFRPKVSAAKYRSIWLPDGQGSPLLHYSRRQADALAERLGAGVRVYAAMRYGQPALAASLNQAMADGAERIVVLPMYPQYSGTTTASVFDAVQSWATSQRKLPTLRLLHSFHDQPSYIEAMAEQIRQHWRIQGKATLLLLSFHGVPERTQTLGDPYVQECQRSAELLAAALSLGRHEWRISFQSRFGRAKWVGPATDATLRQLPTEGVHSVDVFCPGFMADCLETLEEINIEAREIFLEAGGQDFRYIPCLNDSPACIAALHQIVQQELGV